MIDINARGYVSNGQAKVSKGGKAYSKFTLGVKQKDKGFNGAPDTVTWANYQVTDFNNPTPPSDKSYVTLSGFMKVRSYEIEGQKRQALDVICKTLEVAPPLGDAAEPKTQQIPNAKPAPEPWD